MRIVLVTDAWHPQVNGVVRTWTTMRQILGEWGHELIVVNPQGSRTVPAPSEPDLRLCLQPGRQLRRILGDTVPDALHPGATATRDTDQLTADTLAAFFAKDATGKLAVNKMTADGNVVIKTQKETVYGDKGVYDIPAQKAVLTGKVRIMQGNNWLQGTRADVDLKTGISQLFADNNPATENRVYGVFYPKAQTPAVSGAGATAAGP